MTSKIKADESDSTDSQCNANFLAGVEIGVRCCEKGMNLQAAILYAQRIIKEFPHKSIPANGFSGDEARLNMKKSEDAHPPCPNCYSNRVSYRGMGMKKGNLLWECADCQHTFQAVRPATSTQETPLEKCAQCGKQTEETWSASDGVNESIRVCADCKGDL